MFISDKNRLAPLVKSGALNYGKDGLSYSDLGVISWIPMASGVSAVRLGMGGNAIDRAMDLPNAIPPLVDTGFSIVASNYVDDIKSPTSGTIVAKIVISDYHTKLIINSHNDVDYMVDVRTYVKTHEKFGYELHFTDLMKKLRIGDTLFEGDILAHTNSTESGILTVSRPLNVLGIAFNSTEEDAVIISEDIAQKMSYNIYIEIIGHYDPKSEVLINGYGKDGEYKPLPEPGDKIRPDGMVMAKRKIDMTSLGELSDYALSEYEDGIDTGYFMPSGSKGSEVLSVEVISTGCDVEQVKNMMEFDMDVNRQLLQSSKGTKSDEFMCTLINSKKKLERNRKTYRNDSVNTMVKFIIKKTVPLSIKDKITGRYGNKSIISGIFPQEKMGYMEDGTPIDLWGGAGAVGNRNNSPVLMVGGLGTQLRQVRGLFREMVAVPVHADYGEILETDFVINNEQYEFMKAHVLEFLHDLNSPLYEVRLKHDKSEWMYVLTTIIMEDFRVILDEPKTNNIIGLENLKQNDKFKIRKQKFYTSMSGEYEPLEEDISYTVQDYIVQDKLGDRVKAVSLPYENNFGLASKPSSKKQTSNQNNLSPLKITGSTEAHLLSTHCEPERVMEFIEMGKDTKVRNYAYGTILRHKTPTNIEKAVDRNFLPFGKDPFTNLYRAFIGSLGFTHVDSSIDIGSEFDKFKPEIQNKVYTGPNKR